jgi:hypothetical protein
MKWIGVSSASVKELEWPDERYRWAKARSIRPIGKPTLNA